MGAPENVSIESETGVAPIANRWNLVTCFVFRFGFIYLLLYCLPYGGRPSLIAAVPLRGKFGAWVARSFDAPWHALCPWIARHVFGLSGFVTQYHPTGSGDTTLDYAQVFCFFFLALLAAILWSLLDRRRFAYRTLYAWLRLIVRFTLAVSLLSYGFAKVFPLQFGSPSLVVLTETYGESSPMGILWTFMSASSAYRIFSGLAEVGAGVLLLFRRTSTFGALLAVAVFANVVVLNFCYDVPVKLYSTHLLIMSLFLLLPDLSALYDFLLLHRPSQLRSVWLPRWERRWLRIAGAVLQILIICGTLYATFWGSWEFTRQQAEEKRSPLAGAWEIAHITSPASGQDSWQELLFENQFAILRRLNQPQLSFNAQYDKKSSGLRLLNGQTNAALNFGYKWSGKDALVLTESTGTTLELRRAKPFLLTSRGFHWISEFPYNR